MKKLWNILILLAVVLVGCNKTDDLWDEVHDLQKRLTKLEIQVNNLNGNVTALQELYKNGASITNVEEKDGAYTLTLSNGKVLKVVQKMEETIFPIVGINEDGYWTVRYGNSEPTVLTVKAVGNDGKTPEFRINDEGYWEVRYSKDEEWSSKLGPNDESIKAEGSSAAGSEQFFESVGPSADGKTFNIKMKDGKELSVPIVAGISCTFSIDGQTVSGVQQFNSKETKTFKVTLVENVDDITLMAKPEGWTVELSELVNKEATLTVTAPEAVAPASTFAAGRATASNSKDISILVNYNNLSQIFKMQVEVMPEEPAVDYKELYTNGQTITVSDIQINNTNYPNVVDLDDNTSDTDITTSLNIIDKNTIFFMSGNKTFSINSKALTIKADVVFISRKEDNKPTLSIDNEVKLNDNGNLVFKNIKIVTATSKNYLVTNTGTTATASPKGFYCENCHFDGLPLTKNIFYLNAATYKINTIYFKNNKVEVKDPAAAESTMFLTYNAGVNSNVIQNVTIENNTWWYKQGGLANIRVFNHTYTAGENIAKVLNFSFSNNTFINIASRITNANKAAYILVDGTDGLTIKDNIAYCEDNLSAAIGGYGSGFYRIGQAGQTVTISGNIVYGLLESILWRSYPNGGTTVNQEGSNSTIARYGKVPFSNLDFTNGVFTQIPELEGKGSNLK